MEKHATATISHMLQVCSHDAQFSVVTKACSSTENGWQLISVSRQNVTVDSVIMTSENCAYQYARGENDGTSNVIHILWSSGIDDRGSFTSYTIACRLSLAWRPAPTPLSFRRSERSRPRSSRGASEAGAEAEAEPDASGAAINANKLLQNRSHLSKGLTYP